MNKKILLAIVPLIFLGMKLGEDIQNPSQFNKINSISYEEIKCTGIAENSNEVQDSLHSEYVHCKSCGYGVYLMDEFKKERCTFCGVKKQYEQRKW